MDVEIAIRYSDDRACVVTVAKPNDGEVLYRIVTPRLGIPQAVAGGLREARRLFAAEPWAGGQGLRMKFLSPERA